MKNNSESISILIVLIISASFNVEASNPVVRKAFAMATEAKVAYEAARLAKVQERTQKAEHARRLFSDINRRSVENAQRLKLSQKINASVKRAVQVNPMPKLAMKETFAQHANPSLIYLRNKPGTINNYIGKTREMLTYKPRQYAHNLKNTKQTGIPSYKHNFTIVGGAPRYNKDILRVGEQSGIRFIERHPGMISENKIRSISDKGFMRMLGLVSLK